MPFWISSPNGIQGYPIIELPLYLFQFVGGGCLFWIVICRQLQVPQKILSIQNFCIALSGHVANRTLALKSASINADADADVQINIDHQRMMMLIFATTLVYTRFPAPMRWRVSGRMEVKFCWRSPTRLSNLITSDTVHQIQKNPHHYCSEVGWLYQTPMAGPWIFVN